MKKTIVIKLLTLSFVVFLFTGLMACGKGRTPSNEKESLPSPTDVSITLNLTNADESEFFVEWKRVKNAKGYKVDVDGETISATKTKLDITQYLTMGKVTSVKVWASGNGIDYLSSEPTTLTFTPKKATKWLRYVPVSNGYAIERTTTGLSGELILPDTYQNEPITHIADASLGETDSTGKHNPSKISNYTSVRLPRFLTYIGKYSFSYCEYLEEVSVPEGVKTIDYFAFYSCTNLKKVDLGNVEEIGDFAFCNTALTDLVIPKSVTKIDHNAFSANLNLTNVTFEKGSALKECGWFVFEACYGLTEIPKGLPIIGNQMFCGCLGLTSPEIPESVKVIENHAFIGCENLQSIQVPGTVTKLKGGAFVGSPVSETFTIVENHPVYEINSDGIFSRNGKELVKFFNSNNTESYTVPSSVEEISDYAFYGHSELKQVTLPDGLKTIGAFGFFNTGLTEITLPDTVTSFGQQAFTAPNLTKIRLSESLTEIPLQGFNNSKFKHIVIPDSVKKIGDEAFVACYRLESVVLPKGLIECSPRGILFHGGLGELPILPSIYFKGTFVEWNELMQKGILSEKLFINHGRQMPIYFYSEEEPPKMVGGMAYDNNYWHYDENGNPVIWEIEK